MANIPGGTNLLPSVVTETSVISGGVSVPGGSRLAAIIGEGSLPETLVSQAVGGGKDGLNSSYSSTTGSDGRHFVLQNFPIVSNRTTLYKNGVPLTGLESTIDNNSFSDNYDYRIDINLGRIELQKSHITDQGGDGYVPVSTNVGKGSLNSLTLEDVNASPETWTIRCVSVQRDSMSVPIFGTAKFIAIGSISGAKLDANGNAIVWVADGYTNSNDILSFDITETTVAFREGDGFTVKISSGVLVNGDSLTASYIPSANINDPVLRQGMKEVVNNYGSASTDNNLSLGCQLAFANNAPAMITVQAAPPMPRRTSYVLETSVSALSINDDDFIFPLPVGVVPDLNSNIHFFVTDNVTNVETQILPNKFAYYTLDESGQPTTHQFIIDDTSYPAGNSYSYTVVESLETMTTGEDGYIGRAPAFYNKGVFSSPSKTFDSTYVGKTLKLIDTTNRANRGSYTVSSVTDGKLAVTLSALPEFTNETSVTFELIDPTTGLTVVGSSATNGVLTKITSTSTAHFTSGTIIFSTFNPVTSLKLKISGTSNDNDGLYDITALGSNILTIQMTVTTESDMRYELIDSSAVSNYIVVNHNVVPDGNQLRVTIVDERDASFYDAGWINALESLEVVECDMVVPLPKQTISAIFQNTLSHCKAMSNIKNKKERVLFCGAISGLKPENLTGAKSAAVENIGVLEGIQGETVTDVLAGNIEDLANYSVPDAFGNTYRCVYFYPDQIVVQAGSENVLIDGFYIAAAAAGYESADLRLENPLTNKVLSGFTILRNKQFSNLTLEQLAEAGVTTLQPVAGGGRVVWGITTSQSGFVEEQEISIVFIRDRVAKFLRAGFAGFIGTPSDVNTITSLNATAVLLLNSLVSQKLITTYKDLTVVRDSVDPTQFDLTVKVAPTYSINFIYIKVGLGAL